MYAASDWYHISHTPNGIHVHHLDPAALVDRARDLMARDPALGEQGAIAVAVGEYSTAIRRALGFPEDWMNAEGWNALVSPGIPHPSMARIEHDALPDLPVIESDQEEVG